jgi:hypothetical protein
VGIRSEIKLSRKSFCFYTGRPITEPFGFMPLADFQERYRELENSRMNMGAIESAVGIVRKFNAKELQEFITQLEEEKAYGLRDSYQKRKV